MGNCLVLVTTGVTALTAEGFTVLAAVGVTVLISISHVMPTRIPTLSNLLKRFMLSSLMK
jgi:hypothetical protein